MHELMYVCNYIVHGMIDESHLLVTACLIGVHILSHYRTTQTTLSLSLSLSYSVLQRPSENATRPSQTL